MDIIFQGQLSAESLEHQFKDVITLLKNEYHIADYREIHVSLTLIDDEGQEVELVDSQNRTVYRYLEVFVEGPGSDTEIAPTSKAKKEDDTFINTHRNTKTKSKVPGSKAAGFLRLVVDNTKSPS